MKEELGTVWISTDTLSHARTSNRPNLGRYRRSHLRQTPSPAPGQGARRSQPPPPGTAHVISKTDAIVLHARRFRESSKIVTLYTREHGKIGVVAKGVMQPR